MKQRRRKMLARAAIERIKIAYRDGREFTDRDEIKAYIVDQIRISPRKVSIDQAVGWDRQARYELADEHTSVTSPIPSNTLRNPNPSPDDRIKSRLPLIKGWITRGKNLRRLLVADANQIDAKRSEIWRAARIEVLSEMSESLVEVDDGPSDRPPELEPSLR